MTEQRKRKISIRKVLQAVVTILVTTGCVVAILSASGVQDRKIVDRLEIRIENSRSCGFLDEDRVRDMLLGSRHVHLENTPLSRLDLHGMEAILRSNPWVAGAEVYVDNTTALQVQVRQRVPVYRIFQQDGNSYYVDRDLRDLPLSGHYTHYAPVVTNVPVLRDDSVGADVKSRIYHVVQAVSADSFWNAQTAEIRMDDGGTFELVPLMGNHRIILGDTSRIGKKLDHVFAFYRQVLNRIGWDKYQVINASFDGQVVASPSLPWKPPKDKAMSNMSWVKSIMGNTPPDNSAVAISTPAATAATPAAVPAPAAAPVAKPAERTPERKPLPAQNPPAASQKEPAQKATATKPVATPAKAPAARTAPVKPAGTEKKEEKQKPEKGKEEKKPQQEEQTKKAKYLFEGNSN